MVDVDAEGDEDPTQTFVNVDGVDPTVTDPWRPLETSTGPPAALALSFRGGGSSVGGGGGGSSVPPEDKTPLGGSPSNPLGVNRTIQFGASSIYKYDADTPIGGPLEDSPTPVVIPGPGVPEQGNVPLPAIPHTPSRVGICGAQAGMEAAPSLPSHPDQARTTVVPGTTGAPHAPLSGTSTHGVEYALGGTTTTGPGRDNPPAKTLEGGVVRIDGGSMAPPRHDTVRAAPARLPRPNPGGISPPGGAGYRGSGPSKGGPGQGNPLG